MATENIGEHLEQYTFSYLMNFAIARVEEKHPNLDTRQGSVIYDAIAPAMYELADYYMQLRQNYKDTYVMTARNEYLDLKLAEQGIERISATTASRRGDFTASNGDAMDIPVGSRFSADLATQVVNYTVIKPFNQPGTSTPIPGAYELECEETDEIGNRYFGELLPIDYIHGLATATLSTVIRAAREVESDEDALSRYLQAVNSIPFGGNAAQYDTEVKALKDDNGAIIVGALQIYPTWNGGGTVKLSVIDVQYNVFDSESGMIEKLQKMIDPENSQGEQGEGLGFAPIGHKVTVDTPNQKVINIETTIALASEESEAWVRDEIIKEIEGYFLDVRKAWGVSDKYNRYALAVYVAQVNAAILRVQDVNNATHTMLNGIEADMELEQSPKMQELPMLGDVKIHVAN